MPPPASAPLSRLLAAISAAASSPADLRRLSYLLLSPSAPLPPIRCLNTLLMALARHRMLPDMESLASRMPARNLRTYTTLIDAYCLAGDLPAAKRHLSSLLRAGLEPDSHAYTSFVLGYCRAGLLAHACRVFVLMPLCGCTRTAFTYTALLQGLCSAGMVREAMAVFAGMRADGCTPDSHVYSTMVHGLCGVGGTGEANALLARATEEGFVPNVVVYNALIDGYCNVGDLDHAAEVFKLMESQRVRPTIHDVITSKIKNYCEEASKSSIDKSAQRTTSDASNLGGSIPRYQLLKQKTKNGASIMAGQLVVSPISPAMAPTGDAQRAASQLLGSIFECLVDILENHIIVGELLEQKSSEADNVNTPHIANGDTSWNTDSESSQATGGFSIAFSLSVVQSECQQLLCEILRATPEAATADAAVQTARLANKDPVKEKRDGLDGLSFAFRITDAATSVSNEGQGWRRNPTVPQEGYGTASVIPDQGIFLAASVYRPVFEFMNKVGLMLPQKYSQLGNDGLLAFVNNFLKEHFLPAIFVDYRKCVQQAISSPAAFRPRVHATSAYSSSVELGRPVLQGLLAVDIIAKEVLGWVQLMPNYATELVEYVRTFLERTYERCRASYTEALSLKSKAISSFRGMMLKVLMRLEPANIYLQSSSSQLDKNVTDAEAAEVEIELSDLLLDMCPIKQENLIHDDQELILLASLSDSLEYLADSVERLGESFISPPASETKNYAQHGRHNRSSSAIPKGLASLANEYRRLAIDCIRVLRLEMQLETIYHMQEMTKREYVEDQDAEDPDDFIISLTTQISRRDEEMAPYITESKRNYVFGGISSVAANASIKALAQMKSINLLGVQQICRNSVALEQALAAIPSIDSEAVQQRLDRVRQFYELLNLPFECDDAPVFGYFYPADGGDV
ncbi:hypothetical protein ACP70R_049049 [Stipagrostis hirtigluma subsp. patula]